jgi:glycosyltransferase involved in cell wall biosynthesis
MRIIHERGYNWKGTITGAQRNFPLSRSQVYPFKLAKNLPWQEYLELIASSYLGVFHSKGLASCAVLGACTGTPFLGTQFAEGIVNCFPELAVKWGNYEEMAKLAIRLIKEPEWYDEIAMKAEERVDKIYSFEQIRKQLELILKERDLL